MKCITDILFDFDGVIVASDKARYEFLKNRLLDENLVVAFSLDDTVGYSTIYLLNTYFPNLDSTIKDSILKEKMAIALNDINANYPLNQGVFETLNFLKDQNLALHITSSNSYDSIKSVLAYYQLGDVFSTIFAKETMLSSASDYKNYDRVISTLNIDRSNCLVIEDSDIGIQSALNSDMFCLAYKNKNFDDLNQVLRIDEFGGIINFLKKDNLISLS